MPVKSNKYNFIEKSLSIHGKEYDYSLVEYKNSKTNVKIICQKHGVFEQRPDNHLSGQKCKLCTNNNIKSTKEIFISKSKEKFGNYYDYSLVEYINCKTKVTIICPNHGIFEQRPDNHFNTKIPCKKCDSENRLIDLEEVKNRLSEIHNNYYDYSKLEYNGRNKKSIIICRQHGEFKQLIHSHMLGNGCRRCSSSNGEKMISSILNSKKVKFVKEHKFENCKNITHLKFDFYLPSKNICIEYNGLQHYKEVPFFGGKDYLDKIKKNDKIKEVYCKENDIPLIVVKYGTHKDKIVDIITSYLSQN